MLRSQSESLPLQEYRVYNYRYVITVVFCLSKLVSSMMYSCYSPILLTTAMAFDESLFLATLGTNSIWLISYATFGFVANYILDEKGLKIGILLGNVLSLLGLWIRWCATSQNDFIFIFLGQFIAAVGAPLVINAPQKVSATWYKPEDGPFFTTIHSIMGPLGIGLGITMTQFFVDDSPTQAQALEQIKKMNFFYGILGLILLTPSFILFRDKPVTPPSQAAAAEKLEYRESLISLYRNKNYMKFLIGAGSFYGAFNVFGVVLEPIISPFGYHSSDASTIGALFISFGMIGALLAGIHVAKNKNLFSTVFKLIIASTSTTAAITMILGLSNLTILDLAVATFGFVTIPLLPLFLEMANEVSFPVNEATAGGLFIMLNQAIGFFATQIVSWILDIDSKNPSTAKLCSIIAVGLIVCMQIFGFSNLRKVKEDLRRTNYNKTHQNRENSMIELN